MLVVWKGGNAKKLEDEMMARVREEVGSLLNSPDHGVGKPKSPKQRQDFSNRFSQLNKKVADEEIMVLPDLQQALDMALKGDTIVICRYQMP